MQRVDEVFAGNMAVFKRCAVLVKLADSIGNIVNVSIDESVLTDGMLDVKKLQPISFDPINNKYLLLSEEAGDAFKAGLKLK